jgi:thioesterase domain-containing protein
MDEQLLAQLEQTLAHEIPICRAMSFEVVSWREDRLAMRMPLEPNKNHQFSAFAGSLNALCTIVGWGTLFLLLGREGLTGNIVIRRGRIRYLRPVVTSDIVARGLPIDARELAYSFELMRSKGKTKLDVATEIADESGPLVTFQGSYVVQHK